MSQEASFWQREDDVDWSVVPEKWTCFVRATDSMTKQLRGENPEGFRVQLLSQAWGEPLVEEREVLGIPQDERVQVRKVLLYSNHQLAIYARCIFPVSAMQGELSGLQALGEKPLGDILFSTPGMTRSAFQFSMLSCQHALYRDVSEAVLPIKSEAFWARRSVFSVGAKKILVTEVFMPGGRELGRGG